MVWTTPAGASSDDVVSGIGATTCTTLCAAPGRSIKTTRVPVSGAGSTDVVGFSVVVGTVQLPKIFSRPATA